MLLCLYYEYEAISFAKHRNGETAHLVFLKNPTYEHLGVCRQPIVLYHGHYFLTS